MDLKLDIHNIPKYCPQCQQNGLKSKVKKFRLEPNEPKVVMCINGEVRNIISSNNCHNPSPSPSQKSKSRVQVEFKSKSKSRVQV